MRNLVNNFWEVFYFFGAAQTSSFFLRQHNFFFEGSMEKEIIFPKS
jgi:hypothetical protein